jgi:hypothetical protein
MLNDKVHQARDDSAASKACNFDANSATGWDVDVVRKAAGGDLDAQRKLRNVFTAAIQTVDVTSPLAVMFGIEMVPFARLCAAHGDMDDARVLASSLLWTFAASQSAGFAERSDKLAGEAVAILERLADRGDEIASLAAIKMVDQIPAAGDIAKRLIMKGN